MSKEQPKSPLIPTDDVFSASGAGSPPPLAEKPKPISKPQEKIVLDEDDIDDNNSASKPGEEKKKAEKGKSGQKKVAPAKAAAQTGPAQSHAQPPAKPLVQAQAPAAQPAAQPPAAPTLAKATAKAAAQPAAAANQPPVPKVNVERAKKVEERTEAIAEYLKGTDSGSTLIQKIIDMPNDPTLKVRIGFKRLGQVSAEVYGKVIDFFGAFEEKRNTPTVTASELDAFGKTFIATLSKGDLAGFQPALRSIVYQDVRGKLFSEEAKAPADFDAAGKPTVPFILGPAKKAGGASAPRTAETVPPVSGRPATSEAVPARGTAERLEEILKSLNHRTAPVERVETPPAPATPPAEETPVVSEAAPARGTPERIEEIGQKLNQQEESVSATEAPPASVGGTVKTERMKTVFESLVELSASDILKVAQEVGAKTFALSLKRRDTVFLNKILTALPPDGANTIINEMREMGYLSIKIGDKGGEGRVTLSQVVQAEKDVERVMSRIAHTPKEEGPGEKPRASSGSLKDLQALRDAAVAEEKIDEQFRKIEQQSHAIWDVLVYVRSAVAEVGEEDGKSQQPILEAIEGNLSTLKRIPDYLEEMAKLVEPLDNAKAGVIRAKREEVQKWLSGWKKEFQSQDIGKRTIKEIATDLILTCYDTDFQPSEKKRIKEGLLQKASTSSTSAKAKTNTPSNLQETERKAESLSTAEKTGEGKKLTPENVEHLTFQDIFDLNDEDLKLVVLASRLVSEGWGSIMHGMKEPEQQRIRSALEAHPDKVLRSVSDFDEFLRESSTEDAQKRRTNFLDSDERKTLVELLKKRDEGKL